MYFNTKRQVRKSPTGILLEEGHYSMRSCNAERHGYWIERYPSGAMKEQGNYEYNRKIGTWIYYHTNGQLTRVENLAKLYPDELLEMTGQRTQIVKAGTYLEYYPSGQLKENGHYEMVAVYAATDTIFGFDLDTYKETYEIIEREWWMPKSVKVGVWNYYSEAGELIRQEQYNKVKENDQLKKRGTVLWILMEEIWEKVKKNSHSIDD